MASDDPPLISPDDYLLKIHTSFSNIFRSWFWRFYDHLFFLILFNLAWFLTCFLIAWVAWQTGMIGVLSRLNPLGLYGLYFLECMVSIGWAFVVFRIFLDEGGSYKDYWVGVKNYFWKATGVSAVFGFVTAASFFSIRFYYFLNSNHRFIDLLLMSFLFWVILFWFSCSLYQWPILFFQNPPFLKIFYKSFLLVLGNGLLSLGIMAFFSLACILFFAAPFLCFFIGMVFFFSFQCVALEKQFLMYKITYGGKPLEPFLEQLQRERQRGWREFLRPWENR